MFGPFMLPIFIPINVLVLINHCEDWKINIGKSTWHREIAYYLLVIQTESK